MQIEVKRLLPLLIGFVVVAVVLGLMIYLAGNAPAPEPLPVSERSTEGERQVVLDSLRAPESATALKADTLSGLRAPTAQPSQVPLFESLRAQ